MNLISPRGCCGLRQPGVMPDMMLAGVALTGRCDNSAFAAGVWSLLVIDTSSLATGDGR